MSPLRTYWIALQELVLFTLLLVTIEAVDTLFFANTLFDYGIRRGDFDHWYRIFFAPFIHDGWAHVFGNSMGLLLLGSMVLVLGRDVLATVTFSAISVGGLGILFFGTPGVHAGASVIVYGYFGFLLANSLYCRSIYSIVLCILVVVFFRGLAWGMFPSGVPGVSWQSHLFGALGGLSAAAMLAKEAKRRALAAADLPDDLPKIGRPWMTRRRSAAPKTLPFPPSSPTQSQKKTESKD